MPLTQLDLYTEPYGTTGNIGENFLRLLGAPALDPLHTVIREAVQNIADAAKLGTGPQVLVRVRRLTTEQRECLQQYVLRELPEEPTAREKFETFLANIDTQNKDQQNRLNAANTGIDTQIEAIDRHLEQRRALLESAFIQMETAQSLIKQQQAAIDNAFGQKKTT